MQTIFAGRFFIIINCVERIYEYMKIYEWISVCRKLFGRKYLAQNYLAVHLFRRNSFSPTLNWPMRF